MEDLIYQGIQALKGGDKLAARSLLLSALEKNGDSVQAWLWLSGAVESEEDQLECLQQVLRIDPNNAAAIKGATLLMEKGIALPQRSDQDESQSAIESLADGLAQDEGFNPAVQPGRPVEEGESFSEATTSDVTLGLESEADAFANSAQMSIENIPEGEPQGAAIPSETRQEVTAFQTSSELAPETPEETLPEPGTIQKDRGDWLQESEKDHPDADATLKGADATEEESFKLPESFFEPVEEAPEKFPDWLTNPTEDEPESPALLQETQSSEADKRPSASSQPPFVPSMEPATTAMPAQDAEPVRADSSPIGKAEERVLNKIRPSLVTPILVYGLLSILLFAGTIGMLVLITNSDSVQAIAGMILVACLLLVSLAMLIGVSVSHLLASYTLTNRRLYLVQGVVNVKRKSISLETIQSITLKQGPLQKILRSGTLIVQAENPDGGETTYKLIDVSNAKRFISRIEGAQAES